MTKSRLTEKQVVQIVRPSRLTRLGVPTEEIRRKVDPEPASVMTLNKKPSDPGHRVLKAEA